VARNLKASPDYKAISVSDAQLYANGGTLVIAAWDSWDATPPSSVGHVATVRPAGGSENIHTPSPWMNQVGRTIGIKPLGDSFRGINAEQIHFYVPSVEHK
jgi:hypothetical protein